MKLWLLALGAVVGTVPAIAERLSDADFTYANVRYGRHERQTMDVLLQTNTSVCVPVAIFVHGGGWTKGDRRADIPVELLTECRKTGCALITVGYRFLADAVKEGIRPPVRAPMSDIEQAIRFVENHAKEWHIDISRIGLAGGSAGACSCLAVAFARNNAHGIRVVAAAWPQTSLDPREMKEWIPNMDYGAMAFGYETFEEWLAARDEALPWIERFSPAHLARRCAPKRMPIVVVDAPKVIKGQLPQDPKHAGEFRVRFGEIIRAHGGDYREVSWCQLCPEMMRALFGGVK